MQRGVRRSVLENRNWSQQSARSSCSCAGLVACARAGACRSRSWAAARGPGCCPASPPPAAARAADRCCSCAGRRRPGGLALALRQAAAGRVAAAPGGHLAADRRRGRPARAAPAAARAATTATSPSPARVASATDSAERRRGAQPASSAGARVRRLDVLSRIGKFRGSWPAPQCRIPAELSDAIMGLLRQGVNAAQLRRAGCPRFTALTLHGESADKARHASHAHTRRKYSVRHYCNEPGLKPGWRAAASLPVP